MSTDKFRAWDKELKQCVAEGFHVIGEVTMFSMIDDYCAKNPCGKGSLDRLGDIELTRFAGFTDKNKIDVYDKDIVVFMVKTGFFSDLMQKYKEEHKLDGINGISYSASNKYPNMFCYVIELCNLTGVWIKCLKSDYKEPLFSFLDKHPYCKMDEFEVVGSTYANPELLK